LILFAADRHYDVHPGRVLNEKLAADFDIDFYEDDWTCFEGGELSGRYELLILNMIAGSCDVPAPSDEAAAQVRAYMEAGGNLLLLHGASAAFWQRDWWRRNVGYRWVRGNDPDGVESSSHPTQPYRIAPSKTRHPLAASLQAIDLPTDEIYTRLEQVCPAMVLMETTIDEGTFPQCYLSQTEWGGTVLGYVPGHRPDVVGNETMVSNCRTLIEYLV
jgi:hypothetical protein